MPSDIEHAPGCTGKARVRSFAPVDRGWRWVDCIGGCLQSDAPPPPSDTDRRTRLVVRLEHPDGVPGVGMSEVADLFLWADRVLGEGATAGKAGPVDGGFQFLFYGPKPEEATDAE